MPRDFRFFLRAAAILAVAAPAPRSFAEGTPLVGTANGFTFNGYDNDSEGRHRWKLSADKASPKPGATKDKNDWILDNVRIETFDNRTGATFATIRAPRADYVTEERTAFDSGAATVESTGVKLAGRNWRWVNPSSGKHDITMKEDVRVTLLRADAKGDAALPIVITSQRLHATMDDEGTKLEFEGEVTVVQGPATLRCDRMTTYVRGSAGKVSGKNVREAVERIDGEGSVKLTNQSAMITGRTAHVLPARNAFVVAGDAEFNDLGDNRIKVNGDAMRYDATSKTTRTIVVDPPANSPDGRVTAELPSFDAASSREPGNSGLRSHASGRRLEIRMTPTDNTLFFTGDVLLNDDNYRGSCQKLTVESARDGDVDFMSTKTKSDAVKRIVAEDTVTLTRDGRTLHCDRAEIIPTKNSIVLTGSPHAEDPAHGATLEATRMTMDTESKRLVSYGAPGKPVRVKLPELKKSDNAAGGLTLGETFVTGDTLVMTNREKNVGVFEFQDNVTITGEGLAGSCDRLGAEVNAARSVKGAPVDKRIKRIVAVGHVKLRQKAYSAEAGRAEIYPSAQLKELRVADDNGMDGPQPFYVTLNKDDSTPGLRPKLGVTGVNPPKLGIDGAAAPKKPETTPASDADSPMTVEADFHELIQGGDRLRAFSRGAVVLTGRNLSGKSDTAELLATSKTDPVTKRKAFAPDVLVARGHVDILFNERRATAETVEIFPQKTMMALSGKPEIEGWVSQPGVERKTIDWKEIKGADGKTLSTDVRIRDEPAKGMPQSVTRPRLVIPMDSAPDLGRDLKNLDKGD